MDQFLANVLSFPPHPPPAKSLTDAEYDTQIQALLITLNSTPASTFLKPINGSDSILTVLDPSLNPLPFLYAILARINAAKAQSNPPFDTPLWDRVEQFVTSFDPVQVRYVGAQYKELVDELLKHALHSPGPSAQRAMNFVQQAMLRLDPGTSTFTSTHLDVVKICLRRKAWKSCSAILENDIYHFPSSSEVSRHIPFPCGKHLTSSTFITTTSGFTAKLTYRDHLQYFFYGAMLYIAQRNWSRALTFLEFLLVAPVGTNTVSLIQVEAFKKWLLVDILEHGKGGPLPRTISPHVSKYLISLAKPYSTLADAFKEDSPAKLRAVFRVAAEHGVWQQDNNLGLVKLVVAAHRRRQVLNFSNVYSSISLKALAELMNSSAPTADAEDPRTVEADIKKLISSRSIHASIGSGKDGSEMVNFLSQTGEAPTTDAQQAVELQQSLSRVASLEVHVKDAQSRLELTKEYVEATKKRRKIAKDAVESLPGMGDVPAMPGLDDDMLAEY